MARRGEGLTAGQQRAELTAAPEVPYEARLRDLEVAEQTGGLTRKAVLDAIRAKLAARFSGKGGQLDPAQVDTFFERLHDLAEESTSKVVKDNYQTAARNALSILRSGATLDNFIEKANASGTVTPEEIANKAVQIVEAGLPESGKGSEWIKSASNGLTIKGQPVAPKKGTTAAVPVAAPTKAPAERGLVPTRPAAEREADLANEARVSGMQQRAARENSAQEELRRQMSVRNTASLKSGKVAPASGGTRMTPGAAGLPGPGPTPVEPPPTIDVESEPVGPQGRLPAPPNRLALPEVSSAEDMESAARVAAGRSRLIQENATQEELLRQAAIRNAASLKAGSVSPASRGGIVPPARTAPRLALPEVSSAGEMESAARVAAGRAKLAEPDPTKVAAQQARVEANAARNAASAIPGGAVAAAEHAAANPSIRQIFSMLSKGNIGKGVSALAKHPVAGTGAALAVPLVASLLGGLVGSGARGVGSALGLTYDSPQQAAQADLAAYSQPTADDLIMQTQLAERGQDSLRQAIAGNPQLAQQLLQQMRAQAAVKHNVVPGAVRVGGVPGSDGPFQDPASVFSLLNQ